MVDANLSAAAPRRFPVWAMLLGMTALGLGGTLIGYAFHPNKTVGLVGGGAIGFALSMLLFAYVKNRDSKLKLAAGACGTATPAASKFGAALGVWMAIYCLDIVLISWVLDIEAWPLVPRAIAAITPAIPIGGVIFALLQYVKTEPDEYQRLLITRAVLIAMGWTFFVLTAWGFLELYIDAPSFPVAFAMTPFWMFFGIAQLVGAQMIADMSKGAASSGPAVRFKYDMAVTLTAYALTLAIGAVSATWIAVYDQPRWWAIFSALLPVAPPLYGLRAYLRFYRAIDELERRIQSEALVISMTIAGLASFAYGFLEEYAGFAHVPLYWVLPGMIATWVAAQYLARRRYK